LREVDEPADFYAPMADRFGQDPRRTSDPSLAALQAMARAGDTWLDIGAGGGRYTLPLALEVEHVHALDPSPSMLDVLRSGMGEHDIDNISITRDRWPPEGAAPRVDVALMAHVGYDIEAFDAFLDAAEAAAARQCIVIMRSSTAGRASHVLWSEIHGEARVPYPMLQELLVLLMARGSVPEVTLVDRGSWGYPSRGHLFEATRRMLWLRPGSEKDKALQAAIETRATEREGQWEVDWSPMMDGVVSWAPPSAELA